MDLLGQTDPRFTMRVYEQVFDAGPRTVEQLEGVLGCSLEQALAVYSGRQVRGLNVDSRPETGLTPDRQASREGSDRAS